MRYALQSSDGYEWNTEDAFSDSTPEENGRAAFRAYNAFQRLMKNEENGAAQVRTVCTADTSLDMYDLPALPDPRVSVVMTWPAVPLADLADADAQAEARERIGNDPHELDDDEQDRRAAAEERAARPRPSEY